MAKRHRRKLLAMMTAFSVATVLQALPTSCNQYYASAALSAFNWCGVFNCTGGTYFNLCSPVRLFLDCPTTT